MSKYVYAVCNTNTGSNNIVIINAVSFAAAKEKIIRHYFDRYDSIESDDWNGFIAELFEKEGIAISDINDIEGL